MSNRKRYSIRFEFEGRIGPEEKIPAGNCTVAGNNLYRYHEKNTGSSTEERRSIMILAAESILEMEVSRLEIQDLPK